MARDLKPRRCQRRRACLLLAGALGPAAMLAGVLGLAAMLAQPALAQTPAPKPVVAVPVRAGIPAVFPAGGPLAGGTTVTITGPGLAGAIAVSFGSQPAAAFRVVSACQIVAVSPPAGAGTVEVHVSTAGAPSGIWSAGTFTYARAPTVSSAPLSARQSTSVALHATVDAGGLPLTACQFKYGTTTSYGRAVACSQPIRATEAPGAVSAQLTDLQPASTYYYELVVSTLAGTTSGAAGTFTTGQSQVVGAPLVGLLVERVTDRPGVVGELLGIQGIAGAASGESLEVRCVVACQAPLALNVPPLNTDIVLSKITLARPALLSVATRIEIVVSARNEVSRYAIYAFTAAGSSLAVAVTASGCLSASAAAMQCPEPGRASRA